MNQGDSLDYPKHQTTCPGSGITRYWFRRSTLTLVLHKISSSEAYRAVYKALHGIFTGLSLVILSEIQKK